MSKTRILNSLHRQLASTVRRQPCRPNLFRLNLFRSCCLPGLGKTRSLLPKAKHHHREDKVNETDAADLADVHGMQQKQAMCHRSATASVGVLANL